MSLVNTKFAVLLLALVASSFYLGFNDFEKSPVSEFEQWKIKYNVKYESAFQNAYREKIFLEKKAIVELHNKNPSRSYNRGLNRFSAMTKEQFRQTYLTLKSEKSIINPSNQDEKLILKLTAGSIDWRKEGAVTPVKDQGHCGGCWAFSTTGGLEGLSKVSSGSLLNFSEQQLIDCDTDNNGCHGGQMRRALNYVKANGILLNTEYPYKGVQGTCEKPKGNFTLSGYTNLSNCVHLANGLSSQPIMVGVDSSNWDDYESGIFDNCPKEKGEFNHGVLVVGMTNDYWIIKNQWTTEWGENGFMRLKKGDTCNVCNDGMLLHK